MSIKKSIQESIDVKTKLLEDGNNLQLIKDVANTCVTSLKTNGKILLCGNGGSASDAQHIAAELSGRFYYDREPLYAEALHVNTSYVTAVANDYSYDDIYGRMVKAAARPGDVLIGLSTSGNSENVIRAIEEGKRKGMITVGLTGESGGKLASAADICIKVSSNNTARIQETHILIGHLICEMIESTLFPQ